MHINGERLDRDRVKPPQPGRHRTIASILDALDHRFTTGAIEPDRISEIRRTKFLVTLALTAMAGDAIGFKKRFALGDISVFFDIQLGEGAHILNCVLNFITLENAKLPESGHLAHAGFIILRPANAVVQCKLDSIERAAPEPFIISKAGIAGSTGAALTMGGVAVVALAERGFRAGAAKA